MRRTLLLAAIAAFLFACNVSKPTRGNLHSYKDHYAGNKDKAERCSLINVKYTRRGYRHEFMAPDGCILLRYLPHKETIGGCYLLKKYRWGHN